MLCGIQYTIQSRKYAPLLLFVHGKTGEGAYARDSDISLCDDHYRLTIATGARGAYSRDSTAVCAGALK